MIGKRTIICSLLPAYLLLVLHAVIPHHHHVAEGEGPLQYYHGSNHHDHESLDQGVLSDPHCAGRPLHFVHAPEFGQSMVKPGVEWKTYLFESHFTGYAPPLIALTDIDAQKQTSSYQPDDPLHYIADTARGLSLRGPPSSAIA